MEVPAAGLTNTLLAKLFRSMDSNGAAPASASKAADKVGGGENMDEKVTNARRMSRIVRPEVELAPATSGALLTPHAARGSETQKQRPVSMV